MWNVNQDRQVGWCIRRREILTKRHCYSVPYIHKINFIGNSISQIARILMDLREIGGMSIEIGRLDGV